METSNEIAARETTTPVENKPVEQSKTEGTQQPSSDDLMSRVSSFMTENDPENSPKINIDEANFDLNDIEKIQDPSGREQAQKAYNSFQKDFTKKYQSLADLRKQLEAKQENHVWTPEEVQSLVNNQGFQNAAQQLQGTNSDNETSMLSDIEQGKLNAVEKETQALRVQLAELDKQKQDEALKSKYRNYDSIAIDTITSDLMSQKYKATREDLHKVINFDKAVQAAYDMGKQDGSGDRAQKIQSSSYSTDNNTIVTNESEQLKRTEGETNKAFAKRSFMNSFLKLKQRSGT